MNLFFAFKALCVGSVALLFIGAAIYVWLERRRRG
jgi:hypothetical protein